MFGNKAQKAARAAEADAVIQRLLALPVADLAVEIMPVFGPGGVRSKISLGMGTREIVSWLLSSGERGTVQVRQLWQLLGPVREGLQALEHAGLVLRVQSGDSSYVQATRLGLAALAEGSVRSYLSPKAAR